MISYIHENVLVNANVLLKANIPTIIVNLVAGVFIIFLSYDIVRRVAGGLKNKSFEISDEWKIDFRQMPIRFCSLLILYLLLFVAISSIGFFIIYNLFTR